MATNIVEDLKMLSVRWKSESLRSNHQMFDLLSDILAQLRWGILAALLIFTIVQPASGRAGLPTWSLVLAFCAYNLLVHTICRQMSQQYSFVLVAATDLPVVALLYSLGITPYGPVSVLWLLITACAAVSLPLRTSLFYTGVIVMLIVAIAPTLPAWRHEVEQIRALSAELLVIVLVGVGTALMTRRLAQEHFAAETSRKEALQLSELDRLRSDFIMTISHNLRTPLTAARAGLGMLEASANERLDSQELRLLANARRNIERLDRHISDLLALNQIEAGVLQLDLELLDLQQTIADAHASVLPLVEQKGQTLKIALAGPLMLQGDRWRLEQAIVNLLCNAHEHTPQGTHITVAGQDSGQMIVVEVSDDGPGIPAEEQERIFERFRRFGTSEGGAGLGLAIVKGIVELHGGSILVESAAGQGTVFRLLLPKAAPGESYGA